jgi:hypothetical protein
LVAPCVRLIWPGTVQLLLHLLPPALLASLLPDATPLRLLRCLLLAALLLVNAALLAAADAVADAAAAVALLPSPSSSLLSLLLRP